MEVVGSDDNSDRTILVQTDAESLHLRSILEAVLEACSTNDCQDPVSIIIQVNQTECQAEIDSYALDAESITVEGTDGFSSLSKEIISLSIPQKENGSDVTAACNTILLADCILQCQDDRVSHEIGSMPEKNKVVANKDGNSDQNGYCSTDSLHPEQCQRVQTVMPVNSTADGDSCHLREKQQDGISRCSQLIVTKSNEPKSDENGKDKGFINSDIQVFTDKKTVLSGLETDAKCLLQRSDSHLVVDLPQSIANHSFDEIRNVDSKVEYSLRYHPRTLSSKSIHAIDSQSSINRCSGSIKCSVIKGQTCIITGTQSKDRKHHNDKSIDLAQGTGKESTNIRRKIASEDQHLSNQDNGPIKTVRIESVDLSELSTSEQTEVKFNKLTSIKKNLKEDTNIGVHADHKDRKIEDCSQKYCCEPGNKFTCETCGKIFDRKFNLERHLKSKFVHKQPVKKKYVPKPAKCNVCGKMFHSTSAMCLHRKKHDETQRYSCPHCEHKFTQKGNLNFHIKTIHNGIKDVICDRCGKQFSNAAGLVYHNRRIHLEEEMKKRYMQLDCIKKIQSYDEVTKEQNPQVKVLGQVSYTCPICLQTFMKIFSWFAHLNLHTLSNSSDSGVKQQVNDVIAELQGTDNIFNDIVLYPCTSCDYVAFSKSDIIIHLNRHSKDKPYCCDHCDQTFASASECSTHEQYHTKKFRHLCQICKSGFPLLGQLKLHLLKEHQVSDDDLPGSKGYSCDTCGKQFIYKTLLKKHIMSIHEGLKNFICQSCGKAFKTKYAAEVHLRTHTRDCHYSCQACGRSFIDPSNLIHHMKRLHKNLSQSVKKIHSENHVHVKSNVHRVSKLV